ncbi:MAG: FHA domain-containing protein [Candidatus Eremiobacteraeota bacterium]|nr:FHA domain-containing protein [Candidatus Eremiobacteraeota bacterium]
MTFPAHMRVGSFELVLALGAFALVAGRIGPVLRRDAAIRLAPKSVKFEVREPGGSQMLDVAVPAVVGRAREADVMILDPEVSRRHALCDVEAGVLYLTDLESSNGTFLNGKRIVESIELQVGDTIDMGNSRLTVLAVK